MGALIPLALSLAPDIGKWLFGRTGEEVGAAVAKVARTVTGAGTDDEAAAAIAADPALAAQLRVRLAEIAAEREQASRAAELDALKSHFADISDARARDVTLQAGGRRNVRADLLLVVACIGLVACIVVAALGKLAADSAAMGMVISVAGVLAGCFKDAFGFEFGSSRSSERKTELLAGGGR